MFEMRPYHNHRNLFDANPFKEMEAMERRFFRDPFSFFDSDSLAAFRTDVTDEGDRYELEADLPGFRKEDIHLDLSGDTLTVNAERHSSREEKNDEKKYVHSERSWGKYSRSFDVSGIDTEKIRAKYDNGVLQLTLPKKQTALPESRHLVSRNCVSRSCSCHQRRISSSPKLARFGFVAWRRSVTSNGRS